MDVNFRLPKINAATTEEQLSQIHSYMYQLVQELNWAFSAIDSASAGDLSNIVLESGSQLLSQKEAQDTFDSIKSLIIKSADIVKAYYDKMKLEFDGEYIAQSDFGTFRESTKQSIEANSVNITQLFENLQSVTNDMERFVETQAWIKSGELESGVYGVEVGQKTITDGAETFNKYARFTAGGIYFYLPGTSDAVAWMTGTKLFITNAAVQGELMIGKYKIETADGLAFKWVGGVL